MNPTVLGVIGPGFLNQVPTLALKPVLQPGEGSSFFASHSSTCCRGGIHSQGVLPVLVTSDSSQFTAFWPASHVVPQWFGRLIVWQMRSFDRHVCLYIYIHVCRDIHPSPSLSLSLSVPVHLPFPLCQSFSVCVYLSVSLRLSLSISPFLSPAFSRPLWCSGLLVLAAGPSGGCLRVCPRGDLQRFFRS